MSATESHMATASSIPSPGSQGLSFPTSECQNESEDVPSSSDEDEGFDDTESVAQIALGNVSGVIDKLYRLSFKIRNSATRLGFSDARHHHEIDHETGVDLIQQFELADQKHIEEIIASYRRVSPAECEDDFLVRRLARANTFRRQQIKKWKNHAAKRKTTRIQEQHSQPLKIYLPRDLLLPQKTANRPEVPSMPSTATRAPDVRSDFNDVVSEVSISTYAVLSRDSKGQGVVIPALPSSVYTRKEFECPYCCTLCSRSLGIGKAWE